jgi:hypothetical protein
VVRKSWSFAHNRRVIELAKANVVRRSGSDHGAHAGAHSQSCNAIGRFVQIREKDKRLVGVTACARCAGVSIW